MAATRNDSTNKIPPPIEFEGRTVKPDKHGFYRCPYACGDARFPARKWKTEAGFRKHMEACLQRPSLVKARAEADEERKAEALAACPLRIGQRIFYVQRIVVQGTHETRFGRSVKVRYEERLRFEAREAVVESLDWNGQSVVFNRQTNPYYVAKDMDQARKWADEFQRGHEEHLRISAECR